MLDVFWDFLPFLCTALALYLFGRFCRRSRAVPAQSSAAQPASQPSADSTGPIIYFATNDFGLPDREYRFDYRKEQGFWKAYILKMPRLQGRSGSFAVTHRMGNTGTPYVCWDRPLRTLEDAQNVSRVWADHLQEYIATGKRF